MQGDSAVNLDRRQAEQATTDVLGDEAVAINDYLSDIWVTIEVTKRNTIGGTVRII
jgi:hypothetical protein